MMDTDSKRGAEQKTRFQTNQERQTRYREVMMPKIRKVGEKSLIDLMSVAQGDTGQSGVVAKFLLGLYNGRRFPFDMNEFRRLDRSLMEKCLIVLSMDAEPEKEVHEYFEDGGRLFEELADCWYPRNKNA